MKSHPDTKLVHGKVLKSKVNSDKSYFQYIILY